MSEREQFATVEQRYTLEELGTFCQLSASAAIQVALYAIDEEPEAPGHMPDEMWEAIRNDRDVAEEAIRIAVRGTKSGIRERLLAHEPEMRAPSATSRRCPACEREWSELTQAEPGKYETSAGAWLPMDGAPKDQRILLKWGDRIECGGWELQKYHRNPKPYWRGDGEPSFGIKRYREVPPDGWAPLPEAPK